LHEIVIDFVIVTAPKPPGSRQLMMPPAAVLEIAPAHVLQGAVRLQGLTSSPTPETQVRVAWAKALPLANRRSTETTNEKPSEDLPRMTRPLGKLRRVIGLPRADMPIHRTQRQLRILVRVPAIDWSVNVFRIALRGVLACLLAQSWHTGLLHCRM
jgi:hypothetical protein